MEDREAFDWHLPQTKGSRLHLKAIVDSFSVQARKQPTPGILSREGFRVFVSEPKAFSPWRIQVITLPWHFLGFII